jgi:hypothetical protein
MTISFSFQPFWYFVKNIELILVRSSAAGEKCNSGMKEYMVS